MYMYISTGFGVGVFTNCSYKMTMSANVFYIYFIFCTVVQNVMVPYIYIQRLNKFLMICDVHLNDRKSFDVIMSFDI